MKIIIILCCVNILIKMSENYKISIPGSASKKCPGIIPIEDPKGTTYLDLANGTDVELNDCIIRKIQRNQSMQLIKGYVTTINSSNHGSYKHNVVVNAKMLDRELVESALLKTAIQSHWNHLHIIVTAKPISVYTCYDGRFEKYTYHEIQDFLNDLWHKYKIIRVIVSFPLACPKRFIIYGDKKITDRGLYDRTIKVISPKTFKELSSAIDGSGNNLIEGYPVRASLFEEFPTAIKMCDSINNYVKFDKHITAGLCGMDGLVMQDAINYFKFNVSVVKDDDCDTYGYFDGDVGTVTGSLGCLIRDWVDISFNSRFMVQYSEERIHFIHYVSHDPMCFLLKQPDTVPLWHYPYQAYDLQSWSLVTITVVILAVVTWISVKTVNKLIGKTSDIKLHVYIIDYITSTFFGFSFISSNQGFYVLRGICLFCSIILAAVYQGHINYIFTTLARYDKIKSLQELYNSNNILYTSASVNNILKSLDNRGDPIQMNFFTRAQIISHANISIVLQKKHAVTIWRERDAIMTILFIDNVDKNRNPSIYIVQECLCSYYLSYIANIDFPFIKELNIFMERMMQAGLPETYYRWTQRTFSLPDKMPKLGPEPRPKTKTTVQDQCLAFAVLLFGYTVSSITLIVEKWKAKKRLTKGDAHNKRFKLRR